MAVRTRGIFALLAAGMLFSSAHAQTIVLEERDATVWAHEQVVRGRADGTDAGGKLYVDDVPVAFTAAGAFEVPVRLGEGETTLVACADAGAAAVCSDTVRWTLGYRLRPELYTYATVEGGTVTLHGRLLANPDDAAPAFTWAQDPDNPQPLNLAVVSDTVATVSVPTGAAPGEYYFDWTATAADGDVGRARTFVTVDTAGVHAFDIAEDHAAWIDRALIYEVTPYIFNIDGRLSDVTARLPELVELGVNTVWLQPVFGTHGRGQGYDITDYFAVRPDLATEADLHTFVETAHALGLRVLLDFVPNHTALRHPYAQDAVEHGEASHYYDFYRREKSNARFSRHENVKTVGEMDFVYYFWEDLVMLDYDNPEVRRWMEEAGRYWIETFDVDGYRIDAVWGVDARTPDAMQDWRFALKRLKPEVLLLGETSAMRPEAFDDRYDAAYDWFGDESWVSHWTWQWEYSDDANLTLFNHPDEDARAALLRASLTNEGSGLPGGAKVLRFMENNDLFRFAATHSLAETRMAAALLYSLPGLPLLYNGQEIGYGAGSREADHPYNTVGMFNRSRSIREQDRTGLFPFYQRLLAMRATYPALYGDNFEEVNVGPALLDDHLFAFRRWEGAQNLFTVLNMGADEARLTLQLPVEDLPLDAGTTYYLTDLLTGEYVSGTKDELDVVRLTMPGYTARVYLLDDEVAQVPTAVSPSAGDVPEAVALAQNYPNPFNPSTTIAFELPGAGPARLLVYDVMGREVATLVDGVPGAGRHTVAFDGRRLASGVYVYRLAYDGRVVTRTMLLVK